MVAIDPASIIVATSALLATVYGAKQAAAGRADSKRQQEAANKLEARELRNTENEAALKHAREDAEVAYKRLQDERAEVERLRVERERDVKQLAEAHATEAAALRSQLREALMDRSTLQTLVADEIARSSMETARAIGDAEKP